MRICRMLGLDILTFDDWMLFVDYAYLLDSVKKDKRWAAIAASLLKAFDGRSGLLLLLGLTASNSLNDMFWFEILVGLVLVLIGLELLVLFDFVALPKFSPPFQLTAGG